MEKLTQREWLEYINRLQERERQKISSGGISNWVLFAGIGGLSYWLFPEIPNIISNLGRVLLAFVIINNFLQCIFNVFNREFRTHKIVNYRLVNAPYLERQSRKIMKFFELSLALIIFICNILAIYMNHDLRIDIKIALILFTIYSSLVFFGVFGRISNELFRKIEKGDSQGNDFSLFIRFISSIDIYICLYPLISIIVSYQLDRTELQLALFGLIFVFILFMFQLLVMVFTKRLKIAWLEEFERDIIIKELTDFEIRRKMVETYFRLSHMDDYF